MDGEQSPIPTREELIQLARELAPTLEERSENAAALRRIPGKTIEDFHRLGFFKVVQPKRFGGYEIIDNWHVSGLRGSGSKDVAVDGAFVPDHRMHKFADGFRQKSPGHELNSSPVYKYPFGQIHIRSVSTPAVGAAFGALDSYVDFMKSKVSQATGGNAKDSFTNSVVAAEATAVLDREVLAMRRNFEEMAGYLQRGEKIPIDRRVHFRHDSARAARVSTEIVSQLFIACGARAVFEDHPLNRHFQDVYAIRLHHANSPDTPASNMGGVLFGKNNTDFFI